MPRSSTRPKSPATQEISWTKILHEAQQRFGIRRFRPGQREVLESVFRGRNTLALMPTGAGKSLTYQLPALFLPKPVVVVSPLIALMQDQQEKASKADIHVEKLDSTMRHGEAETAAAEIEQGIAQLIYVTPERLENSEFRQSLIDAGGISLLVVDEAHCIAQWGHHFRPAFNTIGEARRALGNPPVLALTATATEEVTREILRSLHAEDAQIVNNGTERQNLFFSVHPTVNIQAKLARILHMLEQEKGSGIIYTASVKSANELYDFLTEHRISVGHYHGRMKIRDRERVQQEFMRGDHKVMIATKAFGLGIDKPDIRFVYHFEFPDSLETYYQEAGRGGRDGGPAHAVLLYRLEDKRIQSFFLSGRYPKSLELSSVYTALAGVAASADNIAAAADVGRRRTQVVLNLLREAGLIRRGSRGYCLTKKEPPTGEALEELLQTYTDRASRDKDRLAEMMHYAETPNCRTQVIRAYFGEPEGEPCLRCDNCALRYPDQADAEALAITPDSRRKAAEHAATQPGTGDEASPHQEEVRTIPTTYGEIHTTAPETILRSTLDSPFQAGDMVRHKRFGSGSVLDIHNDMVLVDFLKAGPKRLRADFLQAA